MSNTRSINRQQQKALKTDQLEPADLESLQFMVTANNEQAERARATQGALNLFQVHLSKKYKLAQGDGLNVGTGAITRAGVPPNKSV